MSYVTLPLGRAVVSVDPIMSIEIDQMDPNAGKRLLDLQDPGPYLGPGSRSLTQWVFCEHCARDYRFGERILNYWGKPCCPSKVRDHECDGSLEDLIDVADRQQLARLRSNAKPLAPFQ